MGKAYGNRDLSESFQEFIDGAAKLVFWLGAIATFLSVGLLVFTCFRVSDSSAATSVADAAKNVEMFQKMLSIGVIALGIGAAVTFWGEELLSALLIIGGLALFFAPLYMPSFLGSSSQAVVGQAMGVIQNGGGVLLIIACIVLVADLATRARNRVKKGSRADQMKYGKGVKEEAGTQNIFLGKCWQLPFCRKFVREKCPIYHAKRTCWRELVGCMCEEQVIRNAMEGKPVSKESLLNGSAIPRNNKLTVEQKRERCRNCIIYNEHQRHKYKASMPIALISVFLIYILGRPVFLPMTASTMQAINTVVSKGTLGSVKAAEPPPIFNEGLLFVGVLVALTYTMKAIEYAIFKLKI